MSNKHVNNDSSAFTCLRLVQDGTTYRRDVLYLESIHDSINVDDLAIRMKQLFYDFEADYAVVDTMGNGIGVFDAMTRILYDEERNVEYPSWSANNYSSDAEAMNERSRSSGVPVIVSYKASAKFNHDCAIALTTSLQNRKIRLPISDIEQREYLVDRGQFLAMRISEQQRQLHTYQQASVLSNELISLEYEVPSGFIRIKEVGNTTKDRYSSLSYGNYFANILERELIETDSDNLYEDMFFISSYT